MKKVFYSMLLMLGITSIIVVSCKKENSNTDSSDFTSAEESAIASGAFYGSFADLSAVATESDALFNVNGSGNQISEIPASLMFSCAEVSVSPKDKTWPKTVTVDFGAGCTFDGVTRKGKIIAVFSDRFRNPGAKINVTYDNFYVNNYHIEGNTSITNNGKNTSGNFNYSLEVKGGKISYDAKSFSFSSVNNIELVMGASTSTPLDDVFSITGSATGTNSKGGSCDVNIVKPLMKAIACKYIVSGSFDIVEGSAPVKTLDFGSGTCDDVATVTVGGVSKEIKLH